MHVDYPRPMGLAAALVALILTGCGAPRSRPDAVPGGLSHSACYQKMAVGIGEDYTAAVRSSAVPFEDLRLLSSNQLHVLRISFPWAEIESQRGVFDWAFWDRFVEEATSRFGFRLVPYVCYTPAWASSRPELPDFWRYPPKDPALFGNFMREIATRYRGKVQSWELWNEPDNPDYWRGTIPEFAAMLRGGAEAVRSADPNATLVLGGLSWDLGFLSNVLTNRTAVSDLQVLNLHNYYETWSGEALERLPDYVGRAVDVLAQHGVQWRLWMAEVGYSSYRSNQYVSGQFEAVYDYEHTEAYQAINVFRILTMLLGTGRVSLTTWYRIHDLPAGVEVIGDQNNRFLGVVDTNGCPKPSLRALAAFNHLFAGGVRVIKNDVRVESPVGSRLAAYAFERPDQSLVLVSWLPAVIAGDRTFPGRPLADSRSELVRWTLPGRTAGKANRIDVLGGTQQSLDVVRRHRECRVEDRVEGGHVNVITFSPAK